MSYCSYNGARKRQVGEGGGGCGQEASSVCWQLNRKALRKLTSSTACISEEVVSPVEVVGGPAAASVA